MTDYRYDFPVGFDRDLAFDAPLAPAVPDLPIELAAQAVPSGTIEASDMEPKVATDGDVTLEVEAQ